MNPTEHLCQLRMEEIRASIYKMPTDFDYLLIVHIYFSNMLGSHCHIVILQMKSHSGPLIV